MRSRVELGQMFRDLHLRETAFLLPNPWDRGTARLLARLGFEALATTSAGYAFSQGLPDSRVGREQMLRHVAEIASAVDLPVSGDLEQGFGDDPRTVADTVELMREHGSFHFAEQAASVAELSELLEE